MFLLNYSKASVWKVEHLIRKLMVRNGIPLYFYQHQKIAGNLWQADNSKTNSVLFIKQENFYNGSKENILPIFPHICAILPFWY